MSLLFFFFLILGFRRFIYIRLVRTRLEFPAHYMDGLRPKKPKNNEFARKDSDDKRMKRKMVVSKKLSSAKSKEVCSFILLTSLITSVILECYLVSTFFFPFFSIS